LKIDKASGWVKGPNDELLLWVPQYLRDDKLVYGSNNLLLVLGKPFLKVGWQDSHHGTDWTKCYVGDRKAKRTP